MNIRNFIIEKVKILIILFVKSFILIILLHKIILCFHKLSSSTCLFSSTMTAVKLNDDKEVKKALEKAFWNKAPLSFRLHKVLVLLSVPVFRNLDANPNPEIKTKHYN